MISLVGDCRPAGQNPEKSRFQPVARGEEESSKQGTPADIGAASISCRPKCSS